MRNHHQGMKLDEQRICNRDGQWGHQPNQYGKLECGGIAMHAEYGVCRHECGAGQESNQGACYYGRRLTYARTLAPNLGMGYVLTVKKYPEKEPIGERTCDPCRKNRVEEMLPIH